MNDFIFIENRCQVDGHIAQIPEQKYELNFISEYFFTHENVFLFIECDLYCNFFQMSLKQKIIVVKFVQLIS